MINCFITSRLDYYNSLLYCENRYSISQLQLCQNNAARVLLNIKYCCPPIKLFMAKPLHTSLSCCLYIHQTGDCHQTPNIFSQFKDAGWKGLADAVLRMPLHRFGTLYLASVKRASSIDAFKSSRRPVCLTWHIFQSIDLFCTSILFVNLKCFLLTSAFWYGDFSPFCNECWFSHTLIFKRSFIS